MPLLRTRDLDYKGKISLLQALKAYGKHLYSFYRRLSGARTNLDPSIGKGRVKWKIVDVVMWQ